jgi:hypothetical protein
MKLSIESGARSARSCLCPGHRFISVSAHDVSRPKPGSAAGDGSGGARRTAAQPEVAVLNLVNWLGNVSAAHIP